MYKNFFWRKKMKNLHSTRILAAILSIAMMISLVLVFTVSGNAAAQEGVYTLNVSDLLLVNAGEKDDGDYQKAGTDNYFTIFYSTKAQVAVNEKSFSDGFQNDQRIAWGDKTTIGDPIKNAIKITTRGAASVKIWWGGGDANRNPAIFNTDGTVLVQDSTVTVKNDLYISELTINAAGTYYIGNVGGSNYFHQIQVSDSGYNLPAPERAAWSGVSAPSVLSAQDDGNGKITLSISAEIGTNGADELLVHFYKDGTLVRTKGSVTEKSTHNISYTPADSGTYTAKIQLLRDGESAKTCDDVTVDFKYPLLTPAIASATSKGQGTIEIIWNSIHEAEKYEIYQDGTKIGETQATEYTASGLTIGQEYSFTVKAVRGAESTTSEAKKATATEGAQRTWNFVTYGPSTSSSNTYTGEVNVDGQVTVSSTGNKGKIQPASFDGVAFYYTAIPSNMNFTLRAKVYVDEWTLTNGQEGFGLYATDRVFEGGNQGNFWNNSYFAGSTKIEYRYNSETEEVYNIDDPVEMAPTKYSMKLGIGAIARTGITPENIALIESSDSDIRTEALNKYFESVVTTLDESAIRLGGEAGTYNTIGNFTATDAEGKPIRPEGTYNDVYLITEYIMEIQKNNTGYFIRYYDAEGNLKKELKYYDPEALSQLDSENVYVGFMTARAATATFSEITLDVIAPENDLPAEDPPRIMVEPTLVVNSGTATNNPNYTLFIDPNVDGTVNVKVNGRYAFKDVPVKKDVRTKLSITLTKYGDDLNQVQLEFTPDPNQELPKFHHLSTTSTRNFAAEIRLTKGNYHQKTIYVSPKVAQGTTAANGSREFPYDIYTALENAYPGQTIVLMEGTYKMASALKIERSMNGTAESPIRLIADSEAATRPVLDFQKLYGGFTIGGSYWYFNGFDVTGSLDGYKGIQVSGNYNVLDNIHTYENGNTGIQLTRLVGADLKEDWPSNNLILNCTSYRNYDGGFEDADGFAAKLTVGDGNVFDGCVAYHNADDGWDLYAKVGTGAIGSVTIRNCIAFQNGYVPGAGSKTGNGNGFKMGGESISGKHVIENSIAFENLMKGIDSNSCPDIIIKNCISFNNGGSNVALYTNSSDFTAFVAEGVISFRTDNLGVAENLKSKGFQVDANYKNATTYYWDPASGTCKNTNGDRITADMFVSLVFDGWERNADGTINLKGFLELKDNVPENAAGCTIGGQASYSLELLPDEKCSFSRVWFSEDYGYHWHECKCGNKSMIEPHNFKTVIDKEQVGTETGLKHDECTVCGFKKAGITIYPPKPEVKPDETPETPDGGETPDTPVTPDNGGTNEPAVELNFFQRLWQAILDFFRNLFGIKPKE